MIKYAKVVNEQTGLCEIGIGTNTEFYKKIGMSELDVTKSEIDGGWYLTEKLDTDKYRADVENLKKQSENETIKNQLTEIDLKSIRALRNGETERLAELEAQAQTLRNKLNK
jgi:hypothetical protein